MKSPQFKLFLLVTVIVAALDLGTKAWVEQVLSSTPDRTLWVWQPWVELTLAYNQGTAFSMVRDLGLLRVIFGVFSLAVVGLLAWGVLRGKGDRWETGAYGLLAAGAFGNGWDRVFREAPNGGTGVVDFVKVNYPWGGSWPAFNVADAALVVGVAMIVLRMLTASRGKQASGNPGPGKA